MTAGGSRAPGNAIVITVLGTKDAVSAGTQVVVDVFVVDFVARGGRARDCD
jgi:hypothetical protein